MPKINCTRCNRLAEFFDISENGACYDKNNKLVCWICYILQLDDSKKNEYINKYIKRFTKSMNAILFLLH